jgi:hypothetical protein
MGGHTVEDLSGLLAQLQQSPTDLRRLVTSIVCRPRDRAWVLQRTIDRWTVRDPAAWTRVQEWLAGRNVRVVPL